MKKNPEIPSHYYNEAVDNVQRIHGHPQLSPDQHQPFAMTRFELIKGAGQADYPHRHDCYEVLYISEGEGTHIIDFEPYPVQPSTFYFLSKDQIHFWQLKKPLKGYALLFPEEFLGVPSSNIIGAHDFSFFHHVGQAPNLFVDPQKDRALISLLAEMEQEFRDEEAQSLSVLRAYLHILLTKLNRRYLRSQQDKQPKTGSALMRQFERLVSEHFLTDHSVENYANRIGISTSHLRDTIKAVTGHAPGQIIRQKIILEAKRLLAHGDITVAEIGYRLNFEDSSYFGRFFKRETGMSPATFRKQIREQYRIAPE
jgi:AraC-like DNA-binding protein/quercetin dioxygenase-like cupin family protein